MVLWLHADRAAVHSPSSIFTGMPRESAAALLGVLQQQLPVNAPEWLPLAAVAGFGCVLLVWSLLPLASSL